MVSLSWDVIRQCVGTALRATPPCVPSLCTVLLVSFTSQCGASFYFVYRANGGRPMHSDCPHCRQGTQEAVQWA
jgi:hypothetical protein